MTDTILRQLFDGELAPSERIKITDPDFKAAAHKLSNLKDNFVKSLSEADSKVFSEIEDLNCECSASYDYEHFALGFKIGAMLVLEVLK